MPNRILMNCNRAYRLEYIEGCSCRSCMKKRLSNYRYDKLVKTFLKDKEKGRHVPRELPSFERFTGVVR